MLKEVADLSADPFATLRRFAGGGSGRTSAAELRFGGGQFFPNLGDCTQHGFGQFLDDMKLAKLMRHIAVPRPTWAWAVPPYAIGSVAAFWTIQRIAAF